MKVRLLDTSAGKVQVADWVGEVHVAQFDSSGLALKEGSWPGSVAETLYHVLGLDQDEAAAIQRQLESEGWERISPADEEATVISGWWVFLAVVVVPAFGLIGVGFLIWLVVDQLA